MGKSNVATKETQNNTSIQELKTTCTRQQEEIRRLEQQLAQARAGQAGPWVKTKRLVKRVGKAVIPARFHPYAKQLLAGIRQIRKGTPALSQQTLPLENMFGQLLLDCQQAVHEQHSTWQGQENERHICFVCDEDKVVPVLVAIASVRHNRDTHCHYVVHVVLSNISPRWDKYFLSYTDSGKDSSFSIDLIRFGDIPVPLLKYSLPEILPHIDTVLYLDNDVIACDGLQTIFACDVAGSLAACIAGSRTPDEQGKDDDGTDSDACINTGIILLNLKKAREDSLTAKLADAQSSLSKQSFMEQKVFSLVLKGKTVALPLRNGTCPEKQNTLYSIYGNPGNSKGKDCLIHFASGEKPWGSPLVPGSEQWHFYFTKSSFYNKRRTSLKGHKGEPVPCEVLKRTQEQKQPKVSVIVPVYNTGPYLHGCIKSILSQSLQDFELILIDDASTDDSLAILKSYAGEDDRITLVRHSKNAGQSVARNTGLTYAQGEYVYFIDSDDQLAGNALEVLCTRAEEDRLDVLRFSASSVYESEELAKKFPAYTMLYNITNDYRLTDGKTLFKALVKNNEYIVSPCLCLIRTEFLRQNNIIFYEGIIYEDNIFTFEVLMNAQKTCCIKDKLYRRLVRECSTMTSPQKYKNYEGYLVTMYCLMRYLENCPAPDQELYAAIGDRIQMYARFCHYIYQKLGAFDRYYLFWLDTDLRITSDLLLQK